MVSWVRLRCRKKLEAEVEVEVDWSSRLAALRLRHLNHTDIDKVTST